MSSIMAVPVLILVNILRSAPTISPLTNFLSSTYLQYMTATYWVIFFHNMLHRNSKNLFLILINIFFVVRFSLKIFTPIPSSTYIEFSTFVNRIKSLTFLVYCIFMAEIALHSLSYNWLDFALNFNNLKDYTTRCLSFFYKTSFTKTMWLPASLSHSEHNGNNEHLPAAWFWSPHHIAHCLECLFCMQHFILNFCIIWLVFSLYFVYSIDVFFSVWYRVYNYHSSSPVTFLFFILV